MQIDDDKKKLRAGRISIIVVVVIVMLLAYLNPPQIYIIMLLSGTVVVCSWFPVCIASVWSKRATKTGAFCGMLCGFLGCAVMKIIGTKVSLPIYLDSFVVGLVANVLGLVIGSKLTTVTKKEEEERARLFVTPAGELVAGEIKKTKRTVAFYIAFGVIVGALLLFLWVIPYHNAL